MNTAIRNNRLTLTIVGLCVVAMTLPAIAQQSETIPEPKLEAVANAYIHVLEIQEEYAPRFEAAQSPEEAQEVQQEASEKMLRVIERQDGVTVDEYNQIMNEVQENENLRDRLIVLVEKALTERAES